MTRPRRKLRVLQITHEDLVPPESLEGMSEAEVDRIKTEVDVCDAMRSLGHDVQILGLRDEMRPLGTMVREFEPHIVFNLLDEFRGEAIFDQHVVAYLELLRTKYTGNNPRGLVLARDKALSKKVAAYHRIRAPRFFVCRMGRKVRPPRSMDYPMIVKSLLEEASMGISKASLVRDFESLEERVHFVHDRIGTDAIVEQFISGRELYMGVIGNDRLWAFPPRELRIRHQEPGEELIATERVKHNVRYQEERGIEIVKARIPEKLHKQLERQSKRIYRALDLQGYARIDYRLSPDGEPYFLEANPNPEIAKFEELATAAEAAGLSYDGLIQRVLNLGLQR